MSVVLVVVWEWRRGPLVGGILSSTRSGPKPDRVFLSPWQALPPHPTHHPPHPPVFLTLSLVCETLCAWWWWVSRRGGRVLSTPQRGNAQHACTQQRPPARPASSHASPTHTPHTPQTTTMFTRAWLNALEKMPRSQVSVPGWVGGREGGKQGKGFIHGPSKRETNPNPNLCVSHSHPHPHTHHHRPSLAAWASPSWPPVCCTWASTADVSNVGGWDGVGGVDAGLTRVG